MPVVDYYRKEGKVIDVSRRSGMQRRANHVIAECFNQQIDSSKSIEDVYSDISTAVNQLHRRKSLSLSRDAATA